MKWLKRVLLALIFILFLPLILPLILLVILILGIVLPVEALRERKAYKKSCYYKAFHLPYQKDTGFLNRYRFYQIASEKKYPLSYVRQSSNGFDYLFFENTVYFLPDFDEIVYDTEKGKWNWIKNSGLKKKFGDLSEYMADKRSLLEEKAAAYPVKILLERAVVAENNLKERTLPDYVFLTLCYEMLFEKTDPDVLAVIPQTARELYDMIVKTPDLCGSFSMLDEEMLHWELNDLFVEIAVEPQDYYVGINQKHGRRLRNITHWHSDPASIYEEVCRIGKLGHVLIVRSHVGRKEVLYMGDKRGCPYTETQKRLWGKLFYFEAK